MFLFTACCTSQSVDMVNITDLDVDTNEKAPTLLVNQRPVCRHAKGGSAVAAAVRPGTTESGPCVVIDEETGAHMQAAYHVDALTRTLNINVHREGTVQVLSCAVELIEDIYQIEDGEECFPSQVLEKLTHGERGGLFMIISRGFQVDGTPAGIDLALSVMVPDTELRVDLLEHLRKLC
jgi:hypothetical protein